MEILNTPLIFPVLFLVVSQGRIDRCGGPVQKKIVGPTHGFRMKGQTTVFCSVMSAVKVENASRPDKDILSKALVVHTFDPVCSELFPFYKQVTLTSQKFLAHTCGGP